MQIATIALLAAGTLMSASSSIGQGRAAKQAYDYQARQQEAAAGQERAMAQRRAAEQRRRETLAQSRLRAVAGAGGGSATDAGVLDLSGDLAEEGELQALYELYNGEERARGLEGGAQLSRFQGKQAKRAGQAAAVSTILRGGSSLLERYG